MSSSTEEPFALANNPFVPPDTCLINLLPNELLSHIFFVGTLSDDEDEDNDDDDDDSYLDERAVLDIPSVDVIGSSIGDWDYSRRAPAADKDANGDPPTSSSDMGVDTEPVLPFAVLVSHVCHHWRNISLSTPDLWCDISVSGQELPPFERVETWLERSKRLPLNIYVECHTEDEDDNDNGDAEEKTMTQEDFVALSKLLYSHIERWNSFQVTMTSYAYIYPLLQLLSAPSTPCASQLTAMQLQHYSDQEDNDNEVLIMPHSFTTRFTILPGGAPKLKEVSLWGVHVNWEDPALGIWRGGALVDLELAYHAENVRPSWAAFVAMLKGSPNLQTLSLSMSGPAGSPTDWYDDGTDSSLNNILELPLKDLVLAWLPPDYVSSLLRRIALPRLTALALDFDDGDYTEFSKQLAGPATTSSYHTVLGNPAEGRSLLMGLESLKLSGLPGDPSCIDLLYSQLLNLNHLNLGCNFLEETFFNKLTPPPLHLPRLTSLATSGIDGAKMCGLIKARKDAGVPLRALFMNEDDNASQQQIDWLRNNVETLEFFEASDEEDEFDEFDEDDEDED